METKTFRMSIKEVGEEGRFTGYLSVFGNVDHGGDLVEKGAFKKTLSENAAFPLLWAHSSQNKDDVVGTFHGQEDKHGLLIDGEFFVDQPGGKQAYDLVKRLSEKKVKVGLSIGYKAIQFEDEKGDNQMIRRLKEIQLFEGSLTLFPMNDQATVVTVKEDLEQKPYPNNHACLLDDSLEVVGSQTRKHNGKEYTVRIGKKKDGGTADRSYLYPTDTWSEAEAKAHCKDHGGTFEAARKSTKTVKVLCGCGNTTMEITDSADEAFDVTEPDAKSTPEAEPPAEAPANRAIREFVESVSRTIKNLTN